MTEEKRRARPAAQYGPTAAAVAANVARLRGARGWSIYALAAALERAGRAITPSAIAKLEKQQRQVTVDDLAALAVVLKVSPASLLLPAVTSGDAEAAVTGGGTPKARDAWAWANGERPLRLTPGDESTELLEFELYAMPPWRRDVWRHIEGVSRGAEVGPRALRQALDVVLADLDRDEGGTDGPSVD
ncbi:helix-turn-helix domain-containing protein [Streptomyces sp. NRRL F-5630]|uniref:helix-turn-helix domain-containing protein n=1 Tax=Streptomyces sp. NRRL F-5630 TaxID=1463864 RepID=UPI003EB71348